MRAAVLFIGPQLSKEFGGFGRKGLEIRSRLLYKMIQTSLPFSSSILILQPKHLLLAEECS